MKWHRWSMVALLLLMACSKNDVATAPESEPAEALAEPAVDAPKKPITHGNSVSEWRKLERGVFVKEDLLVREGISLRVWLYKPPSDAEPLGCILIAPAGSNLLSGMRLSDGDRPEHLPYVRAGYVVVAYEVAGAMTTTALDAEALKAMKTFKDVRAGVTNAKHALEFASSHVACSDPVAVGHSSAATLALLVAAEESSVRAAVAFAPVTDVLAHHGADMVSALDGTLPGFRDFLVWSSPMSHAEELARKPIFLFHAADDMVAAPAESEALLAAMQPAHEYTKRVVVPTGNHYDSMIDSGIPQALEWLAGLPPAR